MSFSPHRLTNLLQSFTSTLRPFPSQMPVSHQAKRTTEKYKAYVEDVKFAGECEIAWLLRWGMGRVVRVERGARDGVKREVRGLLEWERYEDWRGRERISQYNPAHFELFYRGLPNDLATILKEIFNLLMHLAANATDSGLTPSTLSGLFGPLLFGLGPHSCPFDVAHAAYVRSSGAMEHLLLAYIRYEQHQHDRLKGGFPGRLKDWIKGYPGMIVSDRELDQGLPRRGVKVKRLEKIRRNVRAYSRDLSSTGQVWEHELRQHGGIRWEAWEAVLPPPVKSKTPGPRVTEQPHQPRLTEKHRRRLFLATNIIPLPVSSSAVAELDRNHIPRSVSNSSRLSHLTDSPSRNSLVDKRETYGSLADKSWSEFEGFGFGDGVDKNRLDFNLYEGAKKEVLQAKRQTLSWQDFASPQGGFERTNDALSKSLLFSPPVQEQIQHWPEEREEIHKRLKKAHKEAIPFSWDTTPVIVNAQGAFVEEMFLDVWVDFLYGGGWTDTEELTFREANWVLVEYQLNSHSSSPAEEDDGRVFLFEEVVPPAYQDQLSNPKQKKVGGLFSRSKTVRNAAPHKEMPAPHTRDEAEFDAILRRHTPTKQVTLSKPLNGSLAHAELGMLASAPVLPGNSPSKSKFFSRTESHRSSEGNSHHGGNVFNGSGAMKGLFRRRESQQPQTVHQPAPAISTEYDQIDTRTMSGPSSCESTGGDEEPISGLLRTRRQEADRWVDVVVSNPQAMPTRAWTPNEHAQSLRPSLPATPRTYLAVPDVAPTPSKDHSRSSSEDSIEASSYFAPRTPRTSKGYEDTPVASSTCSAGSADGRDGSILQTPTKSSETQQTKQTLGYDLMPLRYATMQPREPEETSLPPVLGAPLAVNPRDTVFSVIEGYGHHHTNSDGASMMIPPVPPLPDPAPSVPPPSPLSRPTEPQENLLDETSFQSIATHMPVPARQSYASGLTDSTEFSEIYSGDADAESYENAVHRSSSVSSEFIYQPPPPIGVDDIAAIARQPSPGRVEHGIPLQSLQEENEDENDGPPSPISAMILRRRAE